MGRSDNKPYEIRTTLSGDTVSTKTIEFQMPTSYGIITRAKNEEWIGMSYCDEPYFYRLDPDGNLLWGKEIFFRDNVCGQKIIELDDGTSLIAAQAGCVGHDCKDSGTIVLNMSASGELI